MSHTDPIVARQVFQAETVQRIAAMLILPEPECAPGNAIPLGWHFPLLGADFAQVRNRRDRFSGLGLPIPEIELPRLVAAGRRVIFRRPIHVAEPLDRVSSVRSFEEKGEAASKIAILTASHAISAPGTPDAAIEEHQTYIFLGAPNSKRKLDPWKRPPGARTLGTFTPDDTTLFQFSALSFNAHRIHLDRAYARDVEGYPDLVVNGGITTLLMTEFARNDLGFSTVAIAVSNKTPLFANRPITFVADQSGSSHRIVALDADGILAAEMDIIAHDV